MGTFVASVDRSNMREESQKSSHKHSEFVTDDAERWVVSSDNILMMMMLLVLHLRKKKNTQNCPA